MTKVTKTLAVMEDLAIGKDNAYQSRGVGKSIDLHYVVNDIEQLKTLDASKYHKARIYSENSYTDFTYVASPTIGIKAINAVGSWAISSPTHIDMLSAQGRVYKGLFTDGFTYSQYNDVGIDLSGNGWIFVGAGAPNKVVAAGTMPSVSEEYKRVTFNDASGIINAKGGSVQDYIDTTDASTLATTSGETIQQRLDAIPNEVDAAGTAQALVNSHNSDASAHPELSAFITSEADRAEVAADASVTNANIYSTVSEGVSGTTIGEQFIVISADGYFYMRRERTSGGSVEVGMFPTEKYMGVISGSGGSFFTARDGFISLDIDAKELTISGGSLFMEGALYTVPDLGIVQLPDLTSKTRLLIYNRVSSTLKAFSSSPTISSGDFVIGAVNFDSSGLPSLIINANVSYGDGKVVYNNNGTLLSSNSAQVNLNTEDSVLEFLGGNRLVAYDFSLAVPSQNVQLPTSTGFYYVILSRSELTISLLSAVNKLSSDQIVFGYLQYRLGSYELLGLYKHQINGEDASGGSSSNISFTGVLSATKDSEIDFNFITQEINITANRVRALYGNTSFLLPQITVDISSVGSNFWYQLVFDTASKTLDYKGTRTPLPEGSILVGMFNKTTLDVFGVPAYTINGSDGKSSAGEPMVSVAPLVVSGNLNPTFDSKVLPDYSVDRAEKSDDHKKIYALYDALKAENPNYITSATLGQDALGNDIKSYTFNSKMINVNSSSVNTKKPKIVMISSVHGFEYAGVWNLYNTMKTICDDYRTNESLAALRWNVEFIIVPIAVPHGYDNGVRTNSNNVDIARNFTASWTYGGEGTNLYSGEEPMSEIETQIIDTLMSENKDAVYFGSHHNFSAPNTGDGFIWNAAASEFGMRLANNLIPLMLFKAQKQFPSMPQGDDVGFGYTNFGAPAGSEGRQAVYIHGINGGTFEINACWGFGSDTSQYSSEVATMGVTTLVNWFLINVKHGVDLLNSKVKLF